MYPFIVVLQLDLRKTSAFLNPQIYHLDYRNEKNFTFGLCHIHFLSGDINRVGDSVQE